MQGLVLGPQVLDDLAHDESRRVLFDHAQREDRVVVEVVHAEAFEQLELFVLVGHDEHVLVVEIVEDAFRGRGRR